MGITKKGIFLINKSFHRYIETEYPFKVIFGCQKKMEKIFDTLFRLKLYPFKAKSIPILGYMFNFVPLLIKKGWPYLNSFKLGQVTATKNKFSK